jgi:hypothetical protein
MNQKDDFSAENLRKNSNDHFLYDQKVIIKKNDQKTFMMSNRLRDFEKNKDDCKENDLINDVEKYLKGHT